MEVLGATVDSVPSDMALCIFHSYTLNQCPENIRNQILLNIEEIAKTRDLFRISLELYSYTTRHTEYELSAYCESHGRSIKWLKDSEP